MWSSSTTILSDATRRSARGFAVVFGDGLQERTLRRARIELVDTVVGATFNENLNSQFVRYARHEFDVPTGLVSVSSADGGRDPEHVARHQADVLFDGPHDQERWDVRWRQGEVTIAPFEFHTSKKVLAEPLDTPAPVDRRSDTLRDSDPSAEPPRSPDGACRHPAVGRSRRDCALLACEGTGDRRARLPGLARVARGRLSRRARQHHFQRRRRKARPLAVPLLRSLSRPWSSPPTTISASPCNKSASGHTYIHESLKRAQTRPRGPKWSVAPVIRWNCRGGVR